MNKYELYKASNTQEILKKYKLRPKKALGQNFLVDGNIIDKICEGAEITKQDAVIEVGPGIGTLTQHLSRYAKKVIAVELDEKLIPVLQETLEGLDNVKVINDDILKVDLEKLIEEEFEGLNVKVVANLPYYITTPIIMKLLESKLNIDSISVMIQKEVAERMIATPGGKDYGALTVAVQYYSKPEIIATVPNTVFVPKPNVDSAVIKLNIYKKPPVEVLDEKLMFDVVKSAFGQRRKTVLNALSGGYLDLEKDVLRTVLEKAEIDPIKRGEVLSIEDYARISDVITDIKPLSAERVAKLSQIFKTLGDPTRLKIIDSLSKQELCVCDIAELIEMNQSATSHQLRVLREQRLVKFRRQGKSVIYSLDDDHVLQLFNQGLEHINHD